jgi:hypothetical protein
MLLEIIDFSCDTLFVFVFQRDHFFRKRNKGQRRIGPLAVPLRYHEKNFFFNELKLVVFVDSRMLITNIISRFPKTLFFLKWSESLY